LFTDDIGAGTLISVGNIIKPKKLLNCYGIAHYTQIYMGIINFLWWPWLGRRRVGAAGFNMVL
jgi:hypothetical protein